jgi:hypothetical protein
MAWWGSAWFGKFRRRRRQLQPGNNSMSDPIRSLTGWTLLRVQGGLPSAPAAQIIRHDPFQFSARMIARHELRVWFEPDWQPARRLARRFPYCAVCSIPAESNTESLRRIPGWRPRRNVGVV